MRNLILVLCLLAVAISPALAGKVTVKVVDPKGKPAPGVQVMITEAGKGCPAPPAKTPTTDRLGNYTKTVKGRAVGYIYKPGFVELYRVLKDGENLFTLEPAGQVWGSVVDGGGKPIANAEVRLVRATRPDGSSISYG